MSAPIFVDNAEAVTDLLEINTQMIKLVVPPSFENLPSETQAELISIHGQEKAESAWKDRMKKLRIHTKGVTLEGLLIVDNEVIS